MPTDLRAPTPHDSRDLINVRELTALGPPDCISAAGCRWLPALLQRRVAMRWGSLVRCALNWQSGALSLAALLQRHEARQLLRLRGVFTGVFPTFIAIGHLRDPTRFISIFLLECGQPQLTTTCCFWAIHSFPIAPRSDLARLIRPPTSTGRPNVLRWRGHEKSHERARLPTAGMVVGVGKNKHTHKPLSVEDRRTQFAP